MQLLPYNSFTLHTHRPLADVAARLDAHIEAPRLRWGFSRDHAPYAGTISYSGFEIRRVIHYRNSFLPQIRGRFEELPRGTNVHIAMGLHPFVTVFLLFWFALWYSICIPIFLSGAGSGDVPTEAGIFLGMPLAVLFAFWCAFWYEAKRAQQELTEIVRGEVLEGIKTQTSPARILLIVAAIGTIVAWNAIAFKGFFSENFSSSSQLVATRPCSSAENASPYCNFALVRSIAGHPTASAIALSSDGKILATGGRDKAIRIWDLQTGQLQKTLQSDSGVMTALAIAPDGRTLVSGSGDRMVRIWDLTADRYPKVLKGHTANILQVRVSADGKTAISASYDEIRVWDLATGELKTTFPDTLSSTEVQLGPVTITGDSPYFRVLDISPDGKTVLAEVNSKILAWDVATQKQKTIPKSLFENLNAARMGLDGKTVVTTSYTQPKTTLKIWDLSTATLKTKDVISTARESWGYGDRLALSRDRILTSTPQGLKVWNLQTVQLEAVVDSEPVSPLIVSPDGKHLVGMTGDASSQTSQIKVWQRP